MTTLVDIHLTAHPAPHHSLAMDPDRHHHSHEAVRKRLQRASGHLTNVIAMLDDERSCVDIAQQLHAVERAIGAAKKQLIHDHLGHCMDHAVEKRNEPVHHVLDEFREIAKYL
jgi:DNA-binding FrmR family transcriptional regulator